MNFNDEQKVETEHSQSLMKNIENFQSDKKYTDVTLCVDGRQFQAHRVVLAACSEYFDKMFSSNMKEKHQPTVSLEEVSAHAIETILRYIYTGKVSLSLDKIRDLLHATHMMQAEGLLSQIVDFLLENINAESCLYLRLLSAMYSLEQVQKSTNEYILTNFEAISRRDSFCDISADDLKKILGSDDVIIKSENIMYEALMRWVKRNVVKRSEVFPTLFSLIRLQLVSLDYLCDEIRQQKLIKEFPSCVAQVEDALDFHIRPSKYKPEKPRRGHIFECNAIAICSNRKINVYNHLNESWSAIPLDQQLPSSCGIASYYQTIAFCGGYPANTQVASTTVITFDGTTWREIPPMLTGRAGASAVFVQGELYVFGGEKRPTRTPDNFVEDIEVLNESEETWISVGNLETQRCFASAVVDKEIVYILGGYLPYQNATYPNRACNIVEAYDVTNKTWTSKTRMTQERACFGAAIWRSSIYIAGGYASNNARLNSSAFMNLLDGTWTDITTQIPVNLNDTWACPAGKNIVIVGSGYEGLLVFNPNTLKYESTTQTLPNLIGGRTVPVVWKQRYY